MCKSLVAIVPVQQVQSGLFGMCVELWAVTEWKDVRTLFWSPAGAQVTAVPVHTFGWQDQE